MALAMCLHPKDLGYSDRLGFDFLWISIMFDLKRQRTPDGFRGRSALFVLLWWAVQRYIFAFIPQPLYGVRRQILRLFGASIGAGVLIRSSVRITYPWRVSIGEYSQVGDYVELYSLGAITIGSNTVVSQKSYLCAGTHDYQDETFPLEARPVKVQSNCWLAADVFVHPGCEIVSGTIVAARSTVCSSIETPGLYGGSPAKFLRPL